MILFLFLCFRTNTQLVNAQTTYANLLQFEIESKRLLGTSYDSTGRLLRQRKKVSVSYQKKHLKSSSSSWMQWESSMKWKNTVWLVILFIVEFMRTKMSLAFLECSVTNRQRLRKAAKASSSSGRIVVASFLHGKKNNYMLNSTRWFDPKWMKWHKLN